MPVFFIEAQEKPMQAVVLYVMTVREFLNQPMQAQHGIMQGLM
jgi:hypothetical protein